MPLSYKTALVYRSRATVLQEANCFRQHTVYRSRKVSKKIRTISTFIYPKLARTNGSDCFVYSSCC